ncbi:hypothetical protein X975_15674, partial [Stegodyphus mimosarum]
MCFMCVMIKIVCLFEARTCPLQCSLQNPAAAANRPVHGSIP